jgi:putative peptidoglycan lipid II flippase
MGPAVIAASAVQVNVMVNGRFASELPGDGPVSWLGYAFRLMQLPLGMFGVAIGTLTLPLISRSAAAGNMEEFRATLSRGMRLAFLLTIPSSVGLILLARPIISLLYEHGRFSAESTVQTAAALQLYALGLAAYSGIKVLAPAFYALDQRNTPMLVSFAAIALNLGLNWLFTFQLGMQHRGLALSTGCVAMANFLALYVLMRRHTGLLDTRLMIRTLAKLALAALPLAVVCWGAETTLLAQWSQLPFSLKLTYLLGTITVGAASFFGTAMALGIDGLEEVSDLFRRKLGRLLRR